MEMSSMKKPILPVFVPPSSSDDSGEDKPSRDGDKERLIRGDEKIFKGSAMTKRGASAAISSMTCAVLLMLFNKAALSSYNSPSANVITLCQLALKCCSIGLCCTLFPFEAWKAYCC